MTKNKSETRSLKLFEINIDGSKLQKSHFNLLFSVAKFVRVVVVYNIFIVSVGGHYSGYSSVVVEVVVYCVVEISIVANVVGIVVVG